MNSFQKAAALVLAVWLEVITPFTYHVKWLVMTKTFAPTPVQGPSIVKGPYGLTPEDKLLAMGGALLYSSYS